MKLKGNTADLRLKAQQLSMQGNNLEIQWTDLQARRWISGSATEKKTERWLQQSQTIEKNSYPVCALVSGSPRPPL